MVFIILIVYTWKQEANQAIILERGLMSLGILEIEKHYSLTGYPICNGQVKLSKSVKLGWLNWQAGNEATNNTTVL